MLGVDVGGTFTDLVTVDTATGAAAVEKVPTTPANQADAVLAGIEALGASPGDFDTIVHGTTSGTNALLERRGARAALVTTEGFRDLLEVGRRTRPQNYGLFGRYDPLVPRQLRHELTERVLADGTVTQRPEPAAVRRLAAKLEEQGVQSIAICFLNSYANPENEEAVADILRAEWPNEFVTSSSQISAQFREFERTSTTAVNAYLQPVIHRYVLDLQQRLEQQGYARRLMIMKANGGVISAETASRLSVYTVLSGPAAGALAAAHECAAADYPNAISGDMGGTSFDVVLIKDGKPAVTSEKEIDYNVPLQIPVVDIQTIGSGGGSVARVDDGGLLHVGPESAGSTPGPIAFGRGGTELTVTDANVLLGRLPERLHAATHRPDQRDAVRRGALEAVGEPLGLEADEAALAVLRVANTAMAAAIRTVSLQRGHDPRDFALFSLGGAGPLHAVELAAELSIPTVIVPPRPGITSAFGCLVADVRHDFAETVNRRLDAVTAEEIGGVLDEHEQAGRAILDEELEAYDRIETSFEADLQYEGQTHVVAVPLAGATVEPARLAADFAAAYMTRYGIEHPERAPVLTNLRTTVAGVRPSPAALRTAGDATSDGQPRPATSRAVRFAQGWVEECPVHQREELTAGTAFDGPAVVEQRDTTTLVHPENRVEVDARGNLIIMLEGAG